MVLIELFWSFLKIGFTSFGGLSMIPLITSEMLSHGWMSASEVSDIVAIAEMTPGPLGLNCSTFAGIRTAGPLGAAVACLGVLTPSLTLCAVAAVFFTRFKNSRRMVQILTGVRPSCIGLVAGVIVSLSLTNYVQGGVAGAPVSYASIGIGLVDLALLLKWKVSIPKVICLSAVLGLLCFGVLQLA